MAHIVAVADLVSRVRQLTDTEHTQFVVDNEILTLLSRMHGKFSDLLVASGHPYYRSTQMITTAGSTGTYPVDDSYRSTLGIEWQAGPTDFRPLQEIVYPIRHKYERLSYGHSVAYELVGTDVVLYPTPPDGQTYRHTYVPQPVDLAAEITVDLVLPAGEEFHLWGAAIAVLAKEESDTAVAERNFAQAKADVLEWVQLRAIHNNRLLVTAENIYSLRDEGDYDY